jgi:hypothetical protein
MLLVLNTMCGHCTHPAVPDPPGGVRFCTHCDAFIPIIKFASGSRRYICKMHMWRASGQRSARKMLNNPLKRGLNQLWGRAYKDSRLFNQKRIAVKQDDIVKLLMGSMAGGIEKTVALGVIAIVPVDPTKVLCMSNAALVSTITRSLLMKRWKLFGEVEYCKLLQESKGSEETMSETRSLTLGHPCN